MKGSWTSSGIRDLYALDIELYKRARELVFQETGANRLFRNYVYGKKSPGPERGRAFHFVTPADSSMDSSVVGDAFGRSAVAQRVLPPARGRHPTT